MESLYLLVPLSVIVVFVAIWVFFAASDSGQFDDLVGPGLRILQDDDSAARITADPISVPTASDAANTFPAPKPRERIG